MGATTDMELDFKSRFYNLQGAHINERKKNFYKLLNSTSLNLPQDQIDIQPRNYQENIFYVDVLIHFKQVEKLIDILKEGVGVLASKILKHQWFFQEAFKNMKEEDLVNNFLPTLAFPVRMKVLKKLSLTLSEDRMDIIFDLLQERYGLFIAKQFLFSCSSQKIVKILKNNEITLLSEQLKRISQKDIEILKVYFEEFKKNKGKDFDDYNFLKYLAWKHPNLYFDLELNKRNIQLGRYTTRAVMKTNREDVLKNIKDFRWNKATLVREVKTFDKEYLFLFFPDDVDHLNFYHSTVSLRALVSKYPIKKRWEVLSQGFKQAYKKEIVEHLEKFDNELSQFFPVEIKQKWAEIKYLESDKNFHYIKYYNPQKAFKLLKDKINVTSDINRRGNLLNNLIKVCHENKDYSTYEAVLKYICVRHRNDDNNVRAIMISYIEKHIDYNLLTEDHWKHINEIIDIQRVRDQSLPFGIIAEYLLFVYQKKHSLDEPVLQYAKDCIKNHRSFRLNRWKEAERHILKHIVKILPTLQLENKTQITYQIMTDIVDFNKSNKNDNDFKTLWIDLNECAPIMDFIREVCTKKEPYNNNDYDVVRSLMLYNCLYSDTPLKVVDEDGLLDLVKAMSAEEDRFSFSIFEVIKKAKRNKFENSLLDFYFNKADKAHPWNKQSGVQHFLAAEPEVVAKYFSVILSLDVECSSMLDYDVIKKYSHLELDKKLISYFKGLVSPSSKYDQIKLFNALATVMDTKSFLDLVKDYTPVEKKLDLKNQEQKDIYPIQCELAKIFRKLDEPLLLAPLIMHFAQGDYLQSSLRAIYRVLYRINEERAFFYLNVLGGRAVSVRKHAVFLGFELLSFKNGMALYSVLSDKETNISSKKYLLDAVLKYFLKNPSDSLLDIVFENMEFVDKNDTEMIQTVVDAVNKIPNRNKPLFIEKVWNFLDIIEGQEVKVNDYRNTVVRTINEQGASFILILNKTFCDNLINKYFLPTNNRLDWNTLDYFAINYLLAYLDQQHFEFVFNVIKSYKNICWESSKEKREYVISFFNNAYKEFDQNDIKFLNLFNNCWQQVFNPKELFSENTLLRLMVLYKENTNIETFSKKVDKLLQGLTEEYGPYISVFLIDSIEKFYLKIHNIPDFTLGNFAFYLLKSNCSQFNCFAAYSIIKNVSIKHEKEIYSKVVDILKAVDNDASKIYCNILLKRS